MNRRTRQLFWSALLVLGAGCGTKEEPNNFPTPPSGGDGGLPGRMIIDAAVPAEAGALPDGATADAPLLKVTVNILSPMKDEPVVAAARFTPAVDVSIDSSAAMMADTVSDVEASVTKMGAKMSSAAAKLSETKLDQVPEAAVAIHHFTDTPVDISMLDSGTYELKVTAKTVGGISAESTVSFVVDAGPAIRIDSPGENKYYRSSVTVDVTITDPLFGPVDKVSMFIGQTALMFNGPSGPSNSQYTATIDFNSYDPALEGDQLLTVHAINKHGTETVVRRKFVSDNKGPDITSTIPTVGGLIGRVITISAVVTDPAGVLDSSVVAVIAHGDTMFEVKLEPAPAGSMAPMGTYQALFDTTRLPVNAIFPTISFRASDIPGNQSSYGYPVSLDNTPPLADLDPPSGFHTFKKDNNVYRCSWAFDPLGDDAVDDGATVAQLFDVRARIEDQGNSPLSGGSDVIPISGIDDSRVQLLILDDTANALVVDTNGDGVCDAINPLLTPTTMPMSDKDALLVNMVPIPVAGNANFTPSVPPPGAPCISGIDTTTPDPLCLTTDLTTAIAYGGGPAIYTVPPVLVGPQCVGRQFDSLANHVNDGWICMAVAVADKLGNLQVSRPLRVCIDKDGKGGECDPATRPAMPDCTGTETSSKPNITVDATKACKPWRAFSPVEFRLVGG